MNNEVEWTNFFNKVFAKVKTIVFEQYQLEKDGSGPPEILAIREAVADFSCPLRIAEIRIDTDKHKHITDEICQIIQYDFSKLGAATPTVEYYNIVDARDSEKLRTLLIEKFNLNEKWFEDFYRDFKTTGWCDDEVNFCTQFPLYDIKKNFEKLIFDFLIFPFNMLLEKIRRKFTKGIDWNSKFNLKPDPMLSISELTKMDEVTGVFLPSEHAGIEKLQEDICNIQLIPSVPEDVKKVFTNAKNLHIYGFFRYNFFAIAQHYAYLALESAIKNRYYQSFDKENILENEKGKIVKVGRIDHQTIIDLCRRTKGWNVRGLKINGEKFAFDTKELLEWLVRTGVLTEWERKQCDKGMRLRHLMSHLTRTYVFPPGYSAEALEFVADIINRLYSSSTGCTDSNSKSVFPVDFSPSKM